VGHLRHGRVYQGNGGNSPFEGYKKRIEDTNDRDKLSRLFSYVHNNLRLSYNESSDLIHMIYEKKMSIK
jgi:hypothetical protein